MATLDALRYETETIKQNNAAMRELIGDMEKALARHEGNKPEHRQERRAWSELAESEQLRRARSYQARHECSLSQAIETLESWG